MAPAAITRAMTRRVLTKGLFEFCSGMKCLL